jgi:uncharacterized protein YabN with tetrapyrrole methylase and pyrophosphatase domain
MPTGSLTVVGTGIGYWGQLTQEAVAHIRNADKVLYLVADTLTANDIQSINESSESLYPFYGDDKERLITYLEMAEHILHFVRKGLTVCAVFYGHPGVFVFPSHEAIARAKQEGFEARMLPAVSAEDCLFADLGVDPGRAGCQSFEATDFLVHKKVFDPTTPLILWQIGVIGVVDHTMRTDNKGLTTLADHLFPTYGKSHTVVIYEAAQYPVCDPIVRPVSLSDLAKNHVTAFSTLYVPPKHRAEPDFAMIERLGIPSSYVKRREDVDIKSDPFGAQTRLLGASRT